MATAIPNSLGLGSQNNPVPGEAGMGGQFGGGANILPDEGKKRSMRSQPCSSCMTVFLLNVTRSFNYVDAHKKKRALM